jgi:hypothetical protein
VHGAASVPYAVAKDAVVLLLSVLNFHAKRSTERSLEHPQLAAMRGWTVGRVRSVGQLRLSSSDTVCRI